MPKIYQIYAQGMPNICQRFDKDVPKICQSDLQQKKSWGKMSTSFTKVWSKCRLYEEGPSFSGKQVNCDTTMDANELLHHIT